jgi:hypothetical protein
MNWAIAVITPNRYLPVLGGQERCLLINLDLAGQESRPFRFYYPDPLQTDVLTGFAFNNFLISFKLHSGSISLYDLIAGIKYRLVFNGDALAYLP